MTVETLESRGSALIGRTQVQAREKKDGEKPVGRGEVFSTGLETRGKIFFRDLGHWENIFFEGRKVFFRDLGHRGRRRFFHFPPVEGAGEARQCALGDGLVTRRVRGFYPVVPTIYYPLSPNHSTLPR